MDAVDISQVLDGNPHTQTKHFWGIRTKIYTTQKPDGKKHTDWRQVC